MNDPGHILSAEMDLFLRQQAMSAPQKKILRDQLDVADLAAVLTPASAYELPAPAAGTYEGQRHVYHIRPTAGINLTMAAGIAIPSDSGITFPKALTINKLYVVQLSFSVVTNTWMLTTVIGGY